MPTTSSARCLAAWIARWPTSRREPEGYATRQHILVVGSMALLVDFDVLGFGGFQQCLCHSPLLGFMVDFEVFGLWSLSAVRMT